LSRTISIKIPAFLLYFLVCLAIFSTLIVASSLVYSSFLTRRLVHYCQTLVQNQEQQRIIDAFADETRKVNRAIAELVQQENRLRKLLGLKSWKSKVKLAANLDELTGKTARISHELKKADLKLAERRKSLEELKSWVNEVRRRYANTPSRWPIYGRIVSRFGYRVYPWRGFHTGLDISGRYGSPIRTTANGTVSFVGWRRGYGRTVIIKHGYGISTLYAHLSRYEVKRGQRVSKGQIICYVGNTGYVTGPHLHYEVRKWNRATNPVSYLNLNILTASRIWRR
jgi:murein DD-endopeptidase MepM/ murein hydrolase activator NlpD